MPALLEQLYLSEFEELTPVASLGGGQSPENVGRDYSETDFIVQYKRELSTKPIIKPEEVIVNTALIRYARAMQNRRKAGELQTEEQVAAIAAGMEQKACGRLIEGNLRFAFWMAGKYAGHGIELLDLIGVANLALAEAVDKKAVRYDPGIAKFTTFIYPDIRKALSKALATQGGPIKLGRGEVSARLKISNEAFNLLKLNIEPTLDVLEERTGIGRGRIRKVIQRSSRMNVVRLQDGILDDECVIADIVADGAAEDPEIEAVRSIGAEPIARVVTRILKDSELEIFLMLAEDPDLSFNDIARITGRPHQRVAQLYNNGIRKLGESLDLFETSGRLDLADRLRQRESIRIAEERLKRRREWSVAVQ